ncbi:MAG: hypothetical protein MR769_04880 [Campylobacter sp.]|uniref:hypothetical protein n=1 Tax=Campylobacter sp. TaxID=205 RepID=UPI002AA7A509|nr:hypothetical protein [Campylobacter sp.]MCI6344002.1 hypothetical protein [Campylobacter sp.]
MSKDKSKKWVISAPLFYNYAKNPEKTIANLALRLSEDVTDIEMGAGGEPDEKREFPKGSLLYRFGHFQENIKENNPLRLTNIARKAAVDYRLIKDKPENDFEVSKINKI